MKGSHAEIADPSSDAQTLTPLDHCVSTLKQSTHLLQDALNLLDVHLADYPPLIKRLQCFRHFELASEGQIRAAQAAVHAEIHPYLMHLLTRITTLLDRLQRREQSLQAKMSLQETRLNHIDTPTNFSRVPESSTLSEQAYRQLRRKKDRLSYAVERLELQARQHERKLRMSMAP